MSLKLKNLSILIVEDIGPVRDLMAMVLKEQGISSISHASDGESGYEAFCRVRPDIIITDWMMPGMDGIELTTAIRTRSDSPDKIIPIILMTGFAAPHKISKARDAGVTEFLVKPFSAGDVSKRIMKIIKQPRDFIITPHFVGPDRRRKKESDVPEDVDKRQDAEGYTEIIKANHLLQAKVGMGSPDEDALLRSQNILEKNNINFAPIALGFLQQFKDAIEQAKAEPYTNRKTIERVINPVMQIKANSRIFKYNLLGDLSSIMLSFLESMNELDADAMAIVEAHYITLHRIVTAQMQGDGGEDGKSLEAELTAACKRYAQSRVARQKKAMKQIMADSK